MTCSPLGRSNCVNGTSSFGPEAAGACSSRPIKSADRIIRSRHHETSKFPNPQISKSPDTLGAMFSRRVPDDRSPNRLSQALARARDRGGVIDLTTSNPTRVRLDYPDDLLAPLGSPAGLRYAPSAFGLHDARQAGAGTYQRGGLAIEPDRIVLTASTSEAYSLLFKLLCEPGGSSVLTPVPSYPLFDHLTRLDGAEQRRYGLEYHGVWTIDLEQLDAAWTGTTRAVLAVSPNNPTGSMLRDHDAAELVSRCARRGAAVIVDEVFCDYPLGAALDEPPALVDPP